MIDGQIIAIVGSTVGQAVRYCLPSFFVEKEIDDYGQMD